MEQPASKDCLTGLSEAEVAARLQQHGYNELPSSKSRSIFATAWEVVREPMFLLLLACGTIYLVLGDVQEALMLLGFVFVVLGITLYQERKTERALEALRDLSSPRALVIRGGNGNALRAGMSSRMTLWYWPRGIVFRQIRWWFRVITCPLTSPCLPANLCRSEKLPGMVFER